VSGSGPAAPSPAAIGDDDNPEWTNADFANAWPIADFPALEKAFPHGGEPRGIASAEAASGGAKVGDRSRPDADGLA